MSKVIVIGGGGHGKCIANCALDCGHELLGFLDDCAEGKVLENYSVIGKISDAPKFKDEAYFIMSMGSGALRQKIVETYPELRWITLIHPRAVVGRDCVIGIGTCIQSCAILQPAATVGDHCFVNHCATVAHDAVMGNFSHLSVSASLCGVATLGDRSFMGANSSVRETKHVCDDVTIGCGAAVVKDITEPGVYGGVPAKKLK